MLSAVSKAVQQCGARAGNRSFRTPAWQRKFTVLRARLVRGRLAKILKNQARAKVFETLDPNLGKGFGATF